MTVLAGGALFANRFEIERLAGSGGMGAVYRARDRRTGAPVALKVLHDTAADPEALERFAREGRLLGELEHPGIVAYVDHGRTPEGRSFLAMEWLDGEDLAVRLARGPLPFDESLALLRRVAGALSAPHGRGVVHRDLKPSNVFLVGGAAAGAKVLDFGIARRAGDGRALTRSGTLIGTPEYMAPEQARGEREVTPSADVFSLGCVLYACLTGRPPFLAEHVAAVLARILFEDPPPLDERRRGVPAPFAALLRRMLAKYPEQRLADAGALSAALDAFDEPAMVQANARPAPHESTFAEREQALLSLVLASPRATPDGGATLPEGEVRADAERRSTIRSALAELGLRAEFLVDGSLVVNVPGAGSAPDQVARAARAGLLVKERWPGCEVALATGRGSVAGSLPVGEVADRAIRLLEQADPALPPRGGVWVDDLSARLSESRFVLEHARGAALLTGEAIALDASRPLLGKPTPCVGREAELGMLDVLLSGSIEDATPRAVLVTAPAGAGKSRLRHEFLRRVEARGGGVTIAIGRGDQMSAGSTFGLLGQALRGLAGIADGEGLAIQRARLGARIGRDQPAEDRDRVIAFVGEVAGVPFPEEADPRLRAARQDPRIMSAQVTRAVLDFLRAECEGRPLLLVLEDLHWGDALTLRLCEAALRELGERPWMVLALARPEVSQILPPSWAGVVQSLPLRPLGRKAAERLVLEVLGEGAPKKTVARIVEQSAGNALFLEELIRCEAEGGGEKAPETVLAILQARIGRFDAGARRALRAASVLGETFWVDAIRALLGPAPAGGEIERWLEVLVGSEMVEERRESRFPGEREMRFRHALVRDAAYELLTADDRALGHRLAGEWLVLRGERDALVLAEHFELGAAGPDAESALARATAYYVEAAERAVDAFDLDAAMLCADRGLRCGARGALRGALLAVKIASYNWREAWPEMVALGPEALDLVAVGSARWSRIIGSLVPAVATIGPPEVLAALSRRFLAAEPELDARGAYVRAGGVWVSGFSITAQREPGRVFLQRMDQIGAAAGAGDLLTEGRASAAVAQFHLMLEHDPWRSMVASRDGAEKLRTCGDRSFYPIVQRLHGEAWTALGDPARAEAAHRDALLRAEEVGEPFLVVYARLYLARFLSIYAAPSPITSRSRPAWRVESSRGWPRGEAPWRRRRSTRGSGARASGPSRASGGRSSRC